MKTLPRYPFFYLGGNFGPEKKILAPPPVYPPTQIPRTHPPGPSPPRPHPLSVPTGGRKSKRRNAAMSKSQEWPRQTKPKKGQFMNFSQGRSGTKIQCESCLFSQGKTPEFTKMGEIHELFVLALSLVWFATGRLLKIAPPKILKQKQAQALQTRAPWTEVKSVQTTDSCLAGLQEGLST